MDTNERSAYAGMYLVDAMRPLAHPILFDSDGWDEIPEEAVDDMHSPLGFLPPLRMGDEWFVFLCPELIAERSEPLGDEEFIDLLTWMRLHMQLHLTHGRVLPMEEREAVIGAEIAETDPAAAVARIRVHA